MSARRAGARAAWLALLLAAAARAQEAPRVPPPFEPLRVTSAAPVLEVALWGRSYRFGAGPLPSEIRSQGVPLAAAPPRFLAAGRFAEREVAWEPPALLEAGPAVVRLRSRGTLPGFALGAETRIEYDGMIAVELELRAERPGGLRSFAYELALPAQSARFFSRHLPYDYQAANVDKRRLLESAGALPDRLALEFVPTLALGDRSVGIEWWSETNAHWITPPAAKPFAVTREGTLARLRVTPIAAPLPLAAGAVWRDAFALFVFPARPAPERWRSVRFLAYNRAASFDRSVGTRFLHLAMQPELRARYDGLPATVDDGAQRALRAELARLGVGYMPYAMLTLAPILHPRTLSQFPDWSAEGRWWRLQPGFDNEVIRRTHPELGPGAPYTYPVCAARRDYFDFVLAESLATLRAEHPDALYYDHGGITRMCVRDPVLAGRPGRESWEYRNVRDFYKRLYEAMRAERPDALLVIHTHGAPKALGAFVDFHVFGEALNAVFAGGHPTAAYRADPSLYTPDYLALPPGYLDAQLFPPVGGVASVIPQTRWAVDPAAPERARGFERALRAVVLSNDAHAPLWVADVETADAIYRALDRFGDVGDAVVHPWWSNQAALRRPDALRVSAWVRDGRALLVLANLEPTPFRGEVAFDRRALGLGAATRLRDLEQPAAQPAPVAGDRFPVALAPRDLRVMALE